MNGTAMTLVKSVKTAAAKYGLSVLSTRNISEVSGVNDALIYHYFKNKEQLLLEAYKYENGNLIQSMVDSITEVEGIPFSFRDKSRLVFHRIWNNMLSDKERIMFCVDFYRSSYFSSAREFHTNQLEQLSSKLRKHFRDESGFRQALYSGMTILYDTAKRVADGWDSNTPELEEQTFQMFYSMISCQIKETVFQPECVATCAG